MTRKYTYKNRSGELISFEETEANNWKMTGYMPIGVRLGLPNKEDNTESYAFVDPSGGPFIQLGDDLGKLFNIKDQLIVSYIAHKNGDIYITTKT